MLSMRLNIDKKKVVRIVVSAAAGYVATWLVRKGVEYVMKKVERKAEQVLQKLDDKLN